MGKKFFQTIKMVGQQKIEAQENRKTVLDGRQIALSFIYLFERKSQKNCDKS